MTQNKLYYGLKDFNIEGFYKSYQEKVELDKRQSKETMEKKCSFLIHNLISRQIYSYNDTAYLNAEVLWSVLGDEYKEILEFLIESKKIKVVSQAIIGKHSRGYRVVNLEKNIIYSEKPYFYPYRVYVERLKKVLKEEGKESLKKTKENLTKPIYRKYLNALKKLKINYTKAQEYIDIRFMDAKRGDKKPKNYHLNILKDYQRKKFKIKVPNENDNRIYHILTSTPRELKYFLNIKFQVDIRNSHPLLFNSLLYDKYEIPQNIRYILSNIIKNNNTIIDIDNNTSNNNIIYNINIKYNNYYSQLNVYNTLKDNNLTPFEIEKVKKIPLDVLRYIYLTSNGLFWDKTLEEDNGKIGEYYITRQDAKITRFAQVFYSKQHEKDENYKEYKYAKQFKEEFPNVFSHIMSYKEYIVKEERTVLAHKLMSLESKLFRKALTRLFEMGFEVVSIHDAIVVLDTPTNANCSIEIVKDVLKEIYKEEGLDCECSVDIYGKEAMEEFLESERELRRMGEELICDLRKDESKKILVKDYENGKSEFIWAKDKKSVILHPKDIKKLMYKQGA